MSADSNKTTLSSTVLMPNSETFSSSSVRVDWITLPTTLDGSDGENRGIGACSLSAANDLDAIRAWLARFADTQTTFDSYRKEAERLLLWAIVKACKPLSSLTHEDFLAYQQFIADPQPRAVWVAEAGRKHGRDDPRWRPFYGPLSTGSRRQALTVLNAMMSWLVEAGYLRANPLALSRRRVRRPTPRITRYLPDDLWQDTLAYIEAMPIETEAQRARYRRARWLFTLLFLGGLRISEVAGNAMGGFFVRRAGDGAHQWWLEVLGKGAKLRLIPATLEMMAELADYRRYHGLAAVPTQSDDTPLVIPFRRGDRPLTRAALHQSVKAIFAGAADRLLNLGGESAARASLLEQASAHWLRHTAGSRMADSEIDLRMIRDTLGHESLSTTSLYLHADDDERYRQINALHRVGWRRPPG